jgi:hypothetical protein
MTLDLHTLFLVTIYIEAILGLLLLVVWAQNLALRALRASAAACLDCAVWYVRADPRFDQRRSRQWLAFHRVGVRVFDERPVEPDYLVTGAMLWLLICRLPFLADATACNP